LPSASDNAAPVGDFEAFVLQHHAEIHRYLCRIAVRMSEADDLSQETFLRAYRAWAGLRPDTNRRAWLYTIATNVYRNHLRSERRRRVAHATVRTTRCEIDLGGPEAEAVARQAGAVTEAAIRGLPLKQRLAFNLRKLEEFDYETIGKSLGCSAESARAHVFRALRKIRIALDGHASRRMGRTSR